MRGITDGYLVLFGRNFCGRLLSARSPQGSQATDFAEAQRQVSQWAHIECIQTYQPRARYTNESQKRRKASGLGAEFTQQFRNFTRSA